MGWPIAIAAFTAVAAAGSAVYGGMSASQQASQQSESYQRNMAYNQQAEENNRRMAEYQRKQVQDAADWDQAMLKDKYDTLHSSQVAKFGASGVEVYNPDDSPLQLMARSLTEYHFDKSALDYRTKLKQWEIDSGVVGMSTQFGAENMSNQWKSDYTKSSSSSYLTGGFLGAGSTLLTGASKYFNSTKGSNPLSTGYTTIGVGEGGSNG